MATPTLTESLFAKTRIEYTTDGGQTVPLYIGQADPGTATSAAGWLIAKCTYDGSGNMTAVDFAGSTDEHNHVWDNRASYVYG